MKKLIRKVLIMPLVAIALFCVAGVTYESWQTHLFLGDQKENLRIYRDPALREKAIRVDESFSELGDLVDQLLQVMYASKGIGLSANQIGRPEALLVVDAEKHHAMDGVEMPLVVFNPEIIERSLETYISEESCLSLPCVKKMVRRPKEITLRYLDREGVERQIIARDSLSRVIQHEVDHLNGISLLDHMGRGEKRVQSNKLGRFALRVFRKAERSRSNRLAGGENE